MVTGEEVRLAVVREPLRKITSCGYQGSVRTAQPLVGVDGVDGRAPSTCKLQAAPSPPPLPPLSHGHAPSALGPGDETFSPFTDSSSCCRTGLNVERVSSSKCWHVALLLCG